MITHADAPDSVPPGYRAYWADGYNAALKDLTAAVLELRGPKVTLDEFGWPDPHSAGAKATQERWIKDNAEAIRKAGSTVLSVSFPETEPVLNDEGLIECGQMFGPPGLKSKCHRHRNHLSVDEDGIGHAIWPSGINPELGELP